MSRVLVVFKLALIAGGLSGCAVHYFDRTTGVEHVWGFSHVVMKATPQSGGVSSVVRGHDVVGLALGKDEEGAYLDIGWGSRRRVQIVDDDAFRLEWPSSSFAQLRVGEALPATVDRKHEKSARESESED